MKRLKSWYEEETIPGAINISFKVVNSGDLKVIQGLFKVLGVKVDKQGNFYFANAKELAVFL